MLLEKIRNRLLRIKFFNEIYYYLVDVINFLKIIISKRFILKRLRASIKIHEKFDIYSSLIPAHQRKNEFCDFINYANRHPISTIVEIGTADSGTHLLLSELIYSSKIMVAIDLEIRNRISMSAINTNNDSRMVIKGSSHSHETYSKLKMVLGGDKIDLLFIDGDHTYSGVKNDFEIYKKLVSPKGIVAFHDIVPDNFSRTGVKTSSYVGDVPKFWNEIKDQFKYVEFKDTNDQDGCGIGVISFEQD
jgi:predicted O-methyltransferase YrrM